MLTKYHAGSPLMWYFTSRSHIMVSCHVHTFMLGVCQNLFTCWHVLSEHSVSAPVSDTKSPSMLWLVGFDLLWLSTDRHVYASSLSVFLQPHPMLGARLRAVTVQVLHHDLKEGLKAHLKAQYLKTSSVHCSACWAFWYFGSSYQST